MCQFDFQVCGCSTVPSTPAAPNLWLLTALFATLVSSGPPPPSAALNLHFPIPIASLECAAMSVHCAASFPPPSMSCCRPLMPLMRISQTEAPLLQPRKLRCRQLQQWLLGEASLPLARGRLPFVLPHPKHRIWQPVPSVHLHCPSLILLFEPPTHQW